MLGYHSCVCTGEGANGNTHGCDTGTPYYYCTYCLTVPLTVRFVTLTYPKMPLSGESDALSLDASDGDAAGCTNPYRFDERQQQQQPQALRAVNS